ncbi:MAG: G1 family glutamic endopeptidase [Trebonia sp.]
MAISTPGTAPGIIRTHPMPPDGFDPRVASPLELRRHGLPQRPGPAVRPDLAARWDEVFSRKLSYITPVFTPVQELVPGIGRPGLPQLDVTVTNPIWSGGVVHATAGRRFGWVTGEWNVPDVAPPANGPGTWYSIAWIGIDGTSDVTQIGTLQSATRDANGLLIKQCYAFYEWWPLSWQAVTNFPVSLGDTMSGLVCLLSPTEASFSMINITQGIHAGFTFTAPAGTASLANQVEWILERPSFNNVTAQLPDFGEIYFDSAVGGRGLDFVVEGGTDTVINMVENGTTVATTTVETPTLIKIAYTGG